MFYDPPHGADEETYLTTFKAVELMNTSPSWLFVAMCPLLQLGTLHERLREATKHKPHKLMAGTLTTIPRSSNKASWQMTTVGVLFLWKGNYDHCTNTIKHSFASSSLSFVCSAPGKSIYHSADNKVVDPTELPPTFCQMLIDRHTLPGDTVVDLCSGSGALACQAFSVIRNVIAVEVDPTRFQWICTRLRAASALPSQDLASVSTSTFESASRELECGTMHEKMGGNEGCDLDDWNCALCDGHMKLAEQQMTCFRCKRKLHEGCAISQEDSGAKIYLCSLSCEQVSQLFSFFFFALGSFLIYIFLSISFFHIICDCCNFLLFFDLL